MHQQSHHQPVARTARATITANNPCHLMELLKRIVLLVVQLVVPNLLVTLDARAYKPDVFAENKPRKRMFRKRRTPKSPKLVLITARRL